MKARIIEFLQQHGGHATAVQIARHVLHVRSASAALADRLVRAALGSAVGIASDGLGSWHLMPGVTEETWQDQKFCLIEVSYPRSQPEALALGWTTILRGRVSRPVFAALPARGLRIAASIDIEVLAAPELCRRLHEVLSEAVLVAWQPARVQQSLSRLAGAAKGAPFFCDTISLPALSQNLFGLQTLPRPEEVCSLLGMPSSLFEEAIAAVEESATAFVEMLARCRAAGLATTGQLLQAGRVRMRRLDMALYNFDRRFLESLPEAPGVYLMRDRRDRVLYVGKAKNLRARVMSYFQRPEEEEPKLRRLQKTLRSLSYEVCDTELDALVRENELIRLHRPEVNRQIDVHDVRELRIRSRPCIFVVPIASHRRLAIYFLSARELAKVNIAAGRKVGKRLRGAVEDFMRHSATHEHSQDDRVLLAARWLAQQRDRLTILAADQFASTEHCLQRLQHLINDEDVFRERLELRDPQ